MTREQYVTETPLDEEGFLIEPLYVPMVYSIGASNYQAQQPLLSSQPPQLYENKPRQATYRRDLSEAPAFVSLYPEANAPPVDELDEENYRLHTINWQVDTITSIALQYGVTEEDIKRLNKLSDLDIYEGNTLVIPKTDVETVRNLIDEDALRQLSEERKQKALIQIFVKTFKSGYDEARYYLSSNQWNMHDAGEEYKEDLVWEQQNKVQPVAKKFMQDSGVRKIFK
jgi:LysM repeat protein